MPKPRSEETEREFIARCIPIVIEEGTAENAEQAAAICYSIWDEEKNKSYNIGSSPIFHTKKEFLNYIKENKTFLVAEKKAKLKYADSTIYNTPVFEKTEQNKSFLNPENFKGDAIKVKAVINTTNIMDSHSDVHLPGIWNKTVKESKGFYLLQEHQMTFSNIISSDVKASVEEMNWLDLGYNAVGKSQALVFEASIHKDRNPFMFEQYLKGYVKEHSVGMQYVKIELAVNDGGKDFEKEQEMWDKYIGQVINRKEAEEQGYFWAVMEAKAIEGSAVVKGSNQVTPTLEISENKESANTTQNEIEPVYTTTQSQYNNNQIKELFTNFKFT